MNKKPSERINYLEYLRVYGCLAVILIHVITPMIDLTYPHELPQRLFVGKLFIEAFCRAAVPIFIMISGSLLLRKERALGYDKIKKYIIRMLLVLAIFGLGFCFAESFINGDRGLQLITNSLLNLIQGKSWTVMWYVYMLIGLYILTPLLKKFTDNAEQKDFVFILAALFITNSVIPTIGYLTGLNLTQFYLTGLIYIFYYLLGQYLYRYDHKKIITIVTGILGVVGIIALNFLPTYHSSGLNLCSIPMVLFTFSLFSAAKHIKREPGKLLLLISKYSFGIYLIHTLWLNIFNKGLHSYPTDFMPFLGEAGFFISTLILSIVSSVILYRLPVFKKILK